MAGGSADVAGALVTLERVLGFLAGVDATALCAGEQAAALLALERAESRHTAVRARFLLAFTAGRGYEDDGQGSVRTWLRWRARITRGAAAGAVGWARRLAGHPVIAAALAAGDLSSSWAREICAWTARLPEGKRDEGDAILVAAAAGGADLPGLAGLAQEMYERSCPFDDGRDPSADRGLWLGTTLEGTGRVEGDLTPACAAALDAVLGSLGRKAGPEDDRSAAQRRHDALAEACTRLIASGMLPGRAAQPTHAQVHLTLSQLRSLPGAAEAEKAWLTRRASQAGWLTGPEAQAAACDATLAPVVSGHLSGTALDNLTQLVLHGPPPGLNPTSPTGLSPTAPSPTGLTRLRRHLLTLAAGILSGPTGLAAALRQATLDGALTTPSLPLDIPLDSGGASPIIPAHLRRAVMARHPHCAFPGCATPAGACHIHHLTPRAAGGRTTLGNLVPLCGFHHLIVIHTWGWQLTLHPDATTTATSPDGRTLHSHSPPAHAA